MIEINSRQNAKFKTWSALTEARGIKKAGRALISGRKLVAEFLKQNPKACEDLIFPPKAAELEYPSPVKAHQLAGPLFKELDVMGTKAPLLVVKHPPIAEWTGESAQGLELIVALSDPGNLGALLRSAEAFGVRRVILSEESASPFLPKTTRGASLANFRLQLASTGPLDQIKVPDAYCLNMSGENLGNFAWPQNLFLILGEEGRGIPAGLSMGSISIPMMGQVESLNAAVAASIALFSYRNRR
jgi:RNA methyltransferase, TrmH family